MGGGGAKEYEQGFPGAGRVMPTPTDLRRACYDILHIVDGEENNAVKRILAGLAFSLAQRAQIESENEAPPAAPSS